MSQVIKSVFLFLFVCFSIMFTVGANAHTVQKRVTDGASYLDKKSPGWDAKINLARLDMLNSYGCILGQLYKTHYLTAMRELNLTNREAEDLGLNSITQSRRAYRIITDEWKKFIKERRAEKEKM